MKKIKSDFLKRGIVFPFLWVVAWEGLGIAGYYALEPFLGLWAQIAMELLVQLPFGIIISKHIKGRRGIEKHKLRKRTVLGIAIAFAVLICVPIQFMYQYMPTSTTGPDDVVPDVFLTLTRMFLTAPIMEEVMFRGVIFSQSRIVFAFWPAAIVGAILFNLVHFNGARYILVTFPLALAASAVFEKTGRLKYCMILHFVFNASGIVILFAQIPPAAIAIPLYVASIILLIAVCAIAVRKPRAAPVDDDRIPSAIVLSEDGPGVDSGPDNLRTFF